MSGESLRGDVYTEGRLKPVTLIFSGLIAWACVCVCVCLRGVCRVQEHVHVQCRDLKCVCGNRANVITL